MSSLTSKAFISALVGAVAVSAHGHVNFAVVDGTHYDGYDVFSIPFQSNPEPVIGWAQTATDNGFVLPQDMATPDIVCHKNGENAGGHAIVSAGSSIMLQWDTWPESHKGPIVDYLANCGESCETVEKTALEFFKIGESGFLDNSEELGRWATDVLMDNGNTWIVDIPTDIAPGNYVLRHEIIALHEGFKSNGAQLYPQCFNILVTGSGTEHPAGVPATELYEVEEEGIIFDIYRPLESYPIPGPALYSGAEKNVAQTFMRATATSSAITDQSIPTAVIAPQVPVATTVTSVPTPTSAPADEPKTEAPAEPTVSATTERIVEAPIQTTAPVKCGGLPKARRHASRHFARSS